MINRRSKMILMRRAREIVENEKLEKEKESRFCAIHNKIQDEKRA